ncbi:repetitive organellar protein-like [Lineus longissimus]|uniref:repetitive organellar protein-like n=1 Tax=Lineus longissimus TaxID=88925 RepID=UPI00315E0089
MKTMNKKKKVVKKVAKEGSHQGFLSQALAEKHLFPRKITLKVLKDEDHAIEMPGLEASVIASRVDIEKVERERHSIADQLQKIFQRVGRLYENAGFPGNIKASHEEEAAALHITNRPPNHDGKRLRKLKTDREKFLKMVKSFSTASGSRFHLIEDVKDWLKNVEIGEELKTEEDYKQLDQECLESEAEVKNGLSHAFASIDEIKRIGYRLLEDAGYLDREDDVHHKRAKLFGQPPEIIYDTQDLLADKTGETIREASAEIKRVLQDTIRLVKTPAAKTMVRGGLKQYKNLMGVTEKSMEKSKTLEDEMSEKDSKLEELEAATENLTQLLDRTQVDIEKVHVVLNNKTVALGKVTEENEILKKKHAALELMTTHLQEELTKVPSKYSAVIKESVDVGLAESVMLEEVEQLRSRVENQEEEMRVLTEDLEAEREISVNLQLSLDRANVRVESKDEGEKKLSEFMEENEDLKNQIVTLNSQLAEKDEIVLDLEKELVEMKLYSPVESGRDLLKTSPNKSGSVVSIKQKVKEKPQKSSPASDHDLKKAISRLQKQTESEMNHLKDHMEREQQRHEAAIRKLEMDHKDHIAIIHKETVHLLRAINHFKESVAQILEKEDLLVVASEVYRLDNLPTEVNQQDPMLSLNRISGDAVELLVAVENKLSQALLNRRCEVKDSSQAMNTTSRELGVQMEITRRLRQQHSQLIEKQNATKDELANVKGTVTAVKKSEALRYYSLYDRYKLLWIHNRNVQRELDNLKRDFLEAMKRREAALRTAISGRQDMVKTIEEQHEKLTKMQVDLRQVSIHHF